METRKLYYEDCHLKTFPCRILSCLETDRGWEIVTDATAFYPEGGGQACDLGELGVVRVLDVRERGETVVHLCDAPLPEGAEVTGGIDWPRRFDLMQQHTGEHIVSGLVNRKWGYHNVGFHVGADVITIDFDGPIPADALEALELEANRAVWENLPVEVTIPAPEELARAVYRTKRALDWPVRIVRVPGYDSCACCGVHVARTGEIGIIKLLSVMSFRGGTRMEMACGSRALGLVNTAFNQNRLVSQIFSAKWQETGAAAQRMNAALEEEKLRCVGLYRRLYTHIAREYTAAGDVLRFEEGLEPVQIRELADAIAQVCGGRAAVFSGEDGSGYAYALVTHRGTLREFGKAMTAALDGRGGGKDGFQQGRVRANRAQIEEFFRN